VLCPTVSESYYTVCEHCPYASIWYRFFFLVGGFGSLDLYLAFRLLSFEILDDLQLGHSDPSGFRRIFFSGVDSNSPRADQGCIIARGVVAYETR